jgi:apolipoprotein N-acyltransferase
MATLTLPPFFLFPLIVPAFCGLIWLMNGAPTRRRIFLDGWWWGWGYYMSGLYWFCIALLTDAEKFAWLIPFALFGLTALIALHNGFACLLASYIRGRGIQRIVIFSLVWTLVEFLRGHWFSGFPWNLAGYVFAVSDSSIQLASIFGIYGLTWIAVFAASIPAVLGDFSVAPRRATGCVALVYLALVLAVGWGAWRLENAGKTQFVDGVALRLVQANIAQHHKWNPDLQMQGLREHAMLTQSKNIETITHVIWPETAVPYVVKEGSRLTEMLGAILPPNATLITGALRSEEAGGALKIWNSVVALNPSGEIIGSYDKHKLVPFGEFLPLRSFIPKTWATPVGNTDFARGAGAATVSWAGLDGISPLICYEAIFPELAADKHHRPSLLLNLTNDAWFGISSGPHQHFHMSRMRAVEQGVPLIRVANTGISAVVDAYGRVLLRLNLDAKGVIDTNLPKMSQYVPFYASMNANMPWIVLISALIIAVVLGRKRYID